METQPPPLSHQAPAEPATDTDGWLPAPFQALIIAALARIFARLERLLQLWLAGALPPPALRHPTPTRKPAHCPHAAPTRCSPHHRRRRAPMRVQATTAIHIQPSALNHGASRARSPAIKPSSAPSPRHHPARAPPHSCPVLPSAPPSVAKTPPREVAKPRPFYNDIITICPLAFPPAIGHRHGQRRKPPWTHHKTA